MQYFWFKVAAPISILLSVVIDKKNMGIWYTCVINIPLCKVSHKDALDSLQKNINVPVLPLCLQTVRYIRIRDMLTKS